MRSISNILLGGVVALGVAGAAMAQDAGQPAGGFPAAVAGAPRPYHPPAEGGAYGVISGLTDKGFTLMLPAGRPVPIVLAPDTTYRLGKARATRHAIKIGDRVRVLGPVDTGSGANRSTTITAAHVVLQPVEGAGSATSLKVAAAVLSVLNPVQAAERAAGGGQDGPGAGGAPPVLDLTRKGLPVPVRHIGNLNPDWGDAADSRTSIAAGEEADRAIEVGMAAPYSAGGLVDRVVKEPDGTLLVHNGSGAGWPRHIFVSASPAFKLIGAAN